MKMYQFKNLISVICALIAIISFTASIMFMADFNNDAYAIACITATAISLFLSICARCGAKEDYEDYMNNHHKIEGMYKKLVKYYNKHYWKLDLYYMIPHFSNKYNVTKFAADIALECQTYMFDCDTENKDPELNKDLVEMTELAQEIIDNKKYI